MAHFVPVLSSVVGRMTSGERRFARRLESHLEDDYVCWYNVPVGAWNQHPDFLILHPRRGLLVIEVKDWKLENIRSMDRLTATLQVDGREVRKSNPLEQAKQYAFGVCRLLESDPALVGEAGSSYQGKLAFPWGYGVVLASISFEAAMPDIDRVMDLQQEQLARSIGEGKTMILATARSTSRRRSPAS